MPSEYTYGDLEAIIQRKFRLGPGNAHIRMGNFKLYNSKNRKHLLPCSEEFSLRPGMNITMAVVLEELTIKGNVCPIPRCKSEDTTPDIGGGRTWYVHILITRRYC